MTQASHSPISNPQPWSLSLDSPLIPARQELKTLLHLLPVTSSSPLSPTLLAARTHFSYPSPSPPVAVLLHLRSFSGHPNQPVSWLQNSLYMDDFQTFHSSVCFSTNSRLIHPMAYLKSVFICLGCISSLPCPTVKVELLLPAQKQIKKLPFSSFSF